jgi:hypothetical protein
MNAFTIDNPIRKLALFLVESLVFEWIMYILIFINAGLLGMVNYNFINT